MKRKRRQGGGTVEFLCRSKQNIAKLVLISFVLTLLLSLQYKAWSGCYTGGGFEDLVVTQNAEWNHSLIDNREAGKSAVLSALCLQIPVPGWDGLFFSNPAPLFYPSIQNCESSIYDQEKITPILLSVRKNE